MEPKGGQLTDTCCAVTPGLLMEYMTELCCPPGVLFEETVYGTSVLSDAVRFVSFAHQLYRSWSTNAQKLQEITDAAI